jgi:multidrug resistance efflux pump
LEAAQAGVDATQAQVDGAQRYLDVLYATRANPLALLGQVHGAQTEAAVAQAAVEEARAALDELTSGPTPEEVATAEAQLHQAQAALSLIEARLGQLRITSPISGTVASRSIQQGETASPGTALMTIVNLDRVTLVIYVSEERIGRVRVNQPVEVTVDSFPDRVFLGRVMTIASEAEFTPRNVQTQDERANLVFAVQVSIPNPDRLLRPGMPADAVIRTD